MGNLNESDNINYVTFGAVCRKKAFWRGGGACKCPERKRSGWGENVFFPPSYITRVPGSL